MIKKFIVRIVIIIIVLYALTIFFPDNAIVKFIIASYKNTILAVWDKLISFFQSIK